MARPNLGLDAGAAAAGMELETLPVRGQAGRLAAENLVLPRLAERFGADVLFTPMGAGPLVGRKPRVTGWHDSTAVHPESPMWRAMPERARLEERLRQGYAGPALRRAARVCVQTRTMAACVEGVFGVPRERIRLVPNGPSALLASEAPAPEEPAGVRRVLLVTTPQPAKNLEVVPRVAAELARLGVRDVEIVVTMSAEAWAPFAGTARAGAVPVRPIGSVAHRELGDLYRSGAAVLVPSWVESFTAAYPEAWHFGLPVVTSDLPFARDLCGDAALYASPARPAEIARALRRALDDGGLRASLRAAGRERLRALPTWDERLARYVSVLEEVGPLG